MSSRGSLSMALCAALAALSCSGDDEAAPILGVGGSTGGSATAAGGDGGVGGSTASGGAAGSAAPSGGTGGSSTGGTAAGGTGTGGTGGGSPTTEPDTVGFEADVWPVLVANCAGVGCHGEGSFLPEHANADVNVAFEEASDIAEEIAGRVSGQLTPIMPQGCGPAPGFGMCLSLEEVALIRAWVDQGAPF